MTEAKKNENSKIDNNINMNLNDNNSIDLQSSIAKANESLENSNSKEFSENAFNALKLHITTYIIELVNESMKNAKREKVDNVSATHVEKASSYLVMKGKGKFKNTLGAIGGIFLGAAVQEIVGIINSTTPPNVISIISISTLILVGTLLVTWNVLGS